MKDDDGAWECLEMVRERLELCGLSMEGCPPMMYDPDDPENQTEH